jgi:hypothetical protein
VKKELLDELINTYQINPNAAAKALYMSGNTDAEAAMAWIEKNQDSPDFTKPMMIAPPRKDFGGFDKQRMKPKKDESKEALEVETKMNKEIEEKMKKREYDFGLEHLLETTSRITEPDNYEELIRKRENGEWAKEEKVMFQLPVVYKRVSEKVK